MADVPPVHGVGAKQAPPGIVARKLALQDLRGEIARAAQRDKERRILAARGERLGPLTSLAAAADEKRRVAQERLLHAEEALDVANVALAEAEKAAELITQLRRTEEARADFLSPFRAERKARAAQRDAAFEVVRQLERAPRDEESELRIALAVQFALYGHEGAMFRGEQPAQPVPKIILTPEEKAEAQSRIASVIRSRVLAGGTIRHGRYFYGPLVTEDFVRRITEAGAEARARGEQAAAIAPLAAAIGGGLAAALAFMGAGTVVLTTVGGTAVEMSAPTWAFFLGTHIADEALHLIDHPPAPPQTEEERIALLVRQTEDRVWDVLLSANPGGMLLMGIWLVREFFGPEMWPAWENYLAERFAAEYKAETEERREQRLRDMAEWEQLIDDIFEGRKELAQKPEPEETEEER